MTYCCRCGEAPAPHTLVELTFCDFCRKVVEQLAEIERRKKGMDDEAVMERMRVRYPRRTEE